MNEATAPRSEIINNLKIGINDKEKKLKDLTNEINNTTCGQNRHIELENIIRITEQEIKFSKQDLNSVNIETAFEKIHEHRKAIAMVEKPYNDQIKIIDDKIDEMISSLMDDRAELVKLSSNDTEQTVEAIETLTDEIREMVLENKKSCSTIWGTCTHVKGKAPTVKWDDAALNVVITSAKGELDYLKEYRTESEAGIPHTRFKLATL